MSAPRNAAAAAPLHYWVEPADLHHASIGIEVVAIRGRRNKNGVMFRAKGLHQRSIIKLAEDLHLQVLHMKPVH